MDADRSRAAPQGPQSRAERQRETREALVEAALVAFARDGYHGANLVGIASEAGFSKGAVYSNFDSKAELFLAVMDYNLSALRGRDWDPLGGHEAEAGGDTPAASDVGSPDAGGDVAEEMLRGFGLATLEFIAIAARDEGLAGKLRRRNQVMLDAYERVARAGRPDAEELPARDVAHLMAALDQGLQVLMLSGAVSGDGTLVRTGLRRLLDPAGAVGEPSPARGEGAAPLPDVEQVRRLVTDMTDD